MSEKPISKESIQEEFARLGIKRDDKIVMHSNLASLGKARTLTKLPNCGADAIIDALQDQIGPNGILCLPTFASTQLAAQPDGPIFDPDTTPSRVGSITNVFRLRKGTVRSLHPTHSWAAAGKDAEEFVKGHDQGRVFDRDSVCGRMYDWDFKILWLGTTGTSNTATHFGEDWLNLPYMTSGDALVKDGDGFRIVTLYGCPSGPRDFYRNGCKLDKLLETWGIQTEGKVHNSTTQIMQLRDFMNHLLRALIDDPLLLLKDDVDDDYHTRFTKLNVEHMEQLKRRRGGVNGILEWLGCALGARGVRHQK